MFKRNISARVVALILMTIMIFPATVFAQGAIDIDHAVTLEVQCTAGETDIADANLDVYYIASVDRVGDYTVSEQFKAYEEIIDFDNMGENADSIAATLEGYVQKDNITPLVSKKTNDLGLVSFSKVDAEMVPGMYLVIGKSVERDYKKYSITPFLVAVPGRDDENNEWDYTVMAYPKCSCEDIEQLCDVEILKVWNDDGNEKSRPELVYVDLLKDGKVYDTAKLSEKNNWKQEWKDLDGYAEWTCTEHKTGGYTVTVEKKDKGFVVTNTYAKGGGTNTPGHTSNTGKLPQTGQLWWPVAALVILGFIFILIGMYRRNKEVEK